MADTVFVKNIIVHANHGVLQSEKELGQRFEIDLSAATDFSECSATDDVSMAICYATMTEIALRTATEASYDLIETLGDRIARAILNNFPQLQAITVTVRKPSAPIPAMFDYAGIQLTRSRSDV